MRQSIVRQAEIEREQRVVGLVSDVDRYLLLGFGPGVSEFARGLVQPEQNVRHTGSLRARQPRGDQLEACKSM